MFVTAITRRLSAHRRVTGLLLAGLVAVAFGFAASISRADTQMLACTDAALSAAFANGGSYTFAGDCSLPVGSEKTLAAGTTLSIDSAGHRVSFYSYVDLGGGHYGQSQFARVDGTLALTGITVSGFIAQGTNGATGTPGAAGVNGGPGQSGTGGGPGGAGGDGASAAGGALVIDASGTVTLTRVTFSDNQALGGAQGMGGPGGAGGQGGGGTAGSSATVAGGNGTAGGDGGAGGNGGDGGSDGGGGDATGGAILNAGTLRILSSTFSGNTARGGPFGGGPNVGGAAGAGGAGGAGGSGDYGNGGNGGNGGQGGKGGHGGAGPTGDSGLGGAIYNTGSLDVSDTAFQGNLAYGSGGQPGFGGRGGDSGWAGAGGGTGVQGSGCGSCVPPQGANPKAQAGLGGRSHAGGDGGDGGSGVTPGTSAGGAVYSTQPFVVSGGSASDSAYGGGTNGSQGGSGGHGGETFDANGNGNLEPDGTAGGPTDVTYTPGNNSAQDFYPDPDSSALKVTVEAFGPNGTTYTTASSTLVARVTVSVAASASGPVSNIAVAPPVSVDPASALAQTGDPTPAAPTGLTLAPGTSTSYTVPFHVNGSGKITLSASATGTAADGVSLEGTGSVAVSGPSPLSIALTTTPSAVRLAVADDGSVTPTTVKVTATLTDTSSSPLDAVVLQSINPEPVTQGQPLDQLALAKGALPLTVGTLQPGQPLTKQFDLQVTGDGKYQLRGIATYGTDTGNGAAVAVGGQFEATVPLLYFAPKRESDNLQPRGDESWIKAGDAWYVSAKLKNESSYKTLCVAPMLPTLQGNAAANGPFDVATADPRTSGGAFAGALAPKHDVSLLMFVQTVVGGATTSRATLTPHAALLPDGGQCTSDTYDGLTKLGGDDLAVPAGAQSDSTVHVDVSQPKPAPRPGGRVLNFLGGIGRELAVNTVQDALGLLSLANWAHTTDEEYKKLLHLQFTPPGTGYAAFLSVRAFQALQTASQVYGWYWKTASPAEKQTLYDQAASVLKRVTNDFYVQGTAGVREVAEPFMKDLEDAYATGDDGKIAYLWGRAGGSVVQQLVMGEVIEAARVRILARTGEMEAAATKVQRGWQETDGARAAARGTDEAATFGKSTVPAGTLLNAAEKEGVWGIDQASDTGFKRISKAYDVLIGIRSRAVEAVKKLKLGSVWKHENLKPKNVNLIDVDWLGFRKADLAEVRFRTYTDQQVAEISNRIRNSGLSLEQRQAIFSRLETRVGEGPKYLKKIERFSKEGEINVGFNYRDNGIKKVTGRDVRKFKLEQESAGKIGNVEAGGEYYTPLQENLELYRLRKTGHLPENCRRLLLSVLCTVTGDLDGVYVVHPDGTGIAPHVLVKIYDELAKFGWQHPETLTWIDEAGNFFFGSKADILKELQVGGEGMVEYAPDGETRATYLNLGQSALFGKSGSSYRVRIIGGYSDVAVAP